MPTRPTLSTSLPGTWELLSRVDVTPSGERVEEASLGSDPIALLVYDRAGHFTAQFMKRDRSVFPVASAPEVSGPNNTRPLGGYDAYFGVFSIDDAAGTVTQRLVGALSPENVGHTVTRAMTVDGDTLTIRLETIAGGRAVTRTLVWKRVG